MLLQLRMWYPLLNSTFALAYMEIFISWDADSDWIPKEKIESSKTPLFSSFLDLRNVSRIFCLLRSFPGAVDTVNCFVFFSYFQGIKDFNNGVFLKYRTWLEKIIPRLACIWWNMIAQHCGIKGPHEKMCPSSILHISFNWVPFCVQWHFTVWYLI